jgi:hypothetical protein
MAVEEHGGTCREDSSMILRRRLVSRRNALLGARQLHMIPFKTMGLKQELRVTDYCSMRDFAVEGGADTGGWLALPERMKAGKIEGLQRCSG